MKKWLTVAILVCLMLIGAGFWGQQSRRSKIGIQNMVAGEKTGRSAVITEAKVEHHKYSGVVEYPEGGVEKMAGVFEGWEVVAGSQDRLMRLRAIEGERRLPEVRIVLGADMAGARMTAYRVIDLNKVGQEDYASSIETVGKLADLGTAKLDKIIRQGDVIEVESNFDGGRPLTDEQGRVVAGYVNLRRFDGISSLRAELK